jgi:hypothetical protein
MHGAACGSVTGPDNCGFTHTVDCGSCPAGNDCDMTMQCVDCCTHVNGTPAQTCGGSTQGGAFVDCMSGMPCMPRTNKCTVSLNCEVCEPQ